eukprot:361278-Chlamydomonas_euryale.AAC.15
MGWLVDGLVGGPISGCIGERVGWWTSGLWTLTTGSCRCRTRQSCTALGQLLGVKEAGGWVNTWIGALLVSRLVGWRARWCAGRLGRLVARLAGRCAHRNAPKNAPALGFFSTKLKARTRAARAASATCIVALSPPHALSPHPAPALSPHSTPRTPHLKPVVHAARQHIGKKRAEGEPPGAAVEPRQLPPQQAAHRRKEYAEPDVPDAILGAILLVVWGVERGMVWGVKRTMN